MSSKKAGEKMSSKEVVSVIFISLILDLLGECLSAMEVSAGDADWTTNSFYHAPTPFSSLDR